MLDLPIGIFNILDQKKMKYYSCNYYSLPYLNFFCLNYFIKLYFNLAK